MSRRAIDSLILVLRDLTASRGMSAIRVETGKGTTMRRLRLLSLAVLLAYPSIASASDRFCPTDFTRTCVPVPGAVEVRPLSGAVTANGDGFRVLVMNPWGDAGLKGYMIRIEEARKKAYAGSFHVSAERRSETERTTPLGTTTVIINDMTINGHFRQLGFASAVLNDTGKPVWIIVETWQRNANYPGQAAALLEAILKP